MPSRSQIKGQTGCVSRRKDFARAPSSQGPVSLLFFTLGLRHLSRSCGCLFALSVSPSPLPSLPFPPHTSLQELRWQGAGPWRLTAAEWEELVCLRDGGCQSLLLHSHCSRRDGGPRKAHFRPPAHRAVPIFWPNVYCCMPHTTMLGISRSSQE